MFELGTGNEPIDSSGQTARKNGVLGQYSLASSQGLEFALASGWQSFRPFRKATEFAHPLEEAAPERQLKFGRNRLERGKRALERDREYRKVTGRWSLSNLQQAVIKRGNLKLRLLQRNETSSCSGKDLLRFGTACAPPRCKLRIQHENNRRYQSVDADHCRREAVQQLRFFLGGCELFGNNLIERIKVVAEASHRGFDLTKIR